MWIAVTERFRQLDVALTATNDQVEDASTKVAGILACLNAGYYGASSQENGYVVGSWGKRTQIVYTEDVDLLFVVPQATYEKFAAYQSNGQSALLQEVKAVLEARYPNTVMRGDGQVVVVGFNTLTLEVIPAVSLTNGQYWICDTHNGGSWRTTDPRAQIYHLDVSDGVTNGNTRRLIRMIKSWKYANNVNIKAFQIELLVVEFMTNYKYSACSLFWYDWILRDFFSYLAGRKNGFVWIPGTSEISLLGDAWAPAADRASTAAIQACMYEYVDNVEAAGQLWQSIFGLSIPRVV